MSMSKSKKDKEEDVTFMWRLKAAGNAELYIVYRRYLYVLCGLESRSDISVSMFMQTQGRIA